VVGVAPEDDDGNLATEKAPQADDRYAEWLRDLEATADNGYEALFKAVTDSATWLREKLKTEPKTWNALKARAEKKRPVPVVAA
jgi:hypothetical protein